MATCAGCDKPTMGAKWCSEACRKRAFRRDGGADRPVRIVPAGDGQVHAAVLAELRELDRDQTVRGQAALALAARIDANADSGSALAALVRQLELTMTAATAGAAVASSLDELRARRDRKRHA